MFSDVKYTGTTPAADAAVYLLFSTTGATGAASGVPGVAPPANFFALAHARTFTLNLKNSQAGTLKWWHSRDRGATWTQLGQEAIAATAATDSVQRVYQVDSMMDWKLDWTNGGSAQATWDVTMALGGEFL